MFYGSYGSGRSVLCYQGSSICIGFQPKSLSIIGINLCSLFGYGCQLFGKSSFAMIVLVCILFCGRVACCCGEVLWWIPICHDGSSRTSCRTKSRTRSLSSSWHHYCWKGIHRSSHERKCHQNHYRNGRSLHSTHSHGCRGMLPSVFHEAISISISIGIGISISILVVSCYKYVIPFWHSIHFSRYVEGKYQTNTGTFCESDDECHFSDISRYSRISRPIPNRGTPTSTSRVRIMVLP